MQKPRVLVLGAGFGGLELTTMLSESLGDQLEITLIDKSDSFRFGFSKLDIMFGRTTPEAVCIYYKNIIKPGVTFRQEEITHIDAEARRVKTNAGVYESDILVVALGADYDIDATPGLAEANEFYTFAGAERISKKLPNFSNGSVVIGVASWPYKCPPAPSEAALMMHDYLATRGVRENCDITIVSPMSSPIPPSPETSRALLSAFAERGITFLASRTVKELDPTRGVALIDDGTEIPYDLYLGVPKHRAPDVVLTSGVVQDGWIPVDPATLATRFRSVYAIGDVASIGIPKAGVFAEGAARVVAESIIAQIRGGEGPAPFAGAAACYIEFGGGRVGKVEVDFLSGATTKAAYTEASAALVKDKKRFGSSRRARWFGLTE